MQRAKKILKLLLAGVFAAILAGVAALYILDRVFPFPVERIDDRLSAASTLLRASDQSLLSWRVDRDENRRLGVKLADVSPWLVEATIAVEDKRFREHLGVDPVAIGRAILQNITAGRRISGASTITMQTIRLLWSRPRLLHSKLVETFRAWQLERLAGKDKILEIYFNLAPYGGNIIGAEAAARRYFGKSAKQLNLAEAALLAGLPQSPARLNPLPHPEAALRRRAIVLQRMVEDGRIDAAQAERAAGEPLDISPRENRLDAPHFADYVFSQTPFGAAAVESTLVPELQARIMELAGRQGADLSAKGVAGPAVVVLSLADSSILAYVGNASPDSSPARQVDGVRVRRQPGSLLKPFIFALLAGEGKLTPSTRVYDLPRAWGDYAPRNMDRQWLGGMSASDALRQSRNITAVKQLQSLGLDRFADFMQNIGLDPGARGRYGLTLALGAKEQNLLALTNAYAALGRLGLWLPIRYSPQTQAARPARVLSPEASWLALSALAGPEAEQTPRLVWKTGTSWNQLDAWAVAMTPEYAVGVWCGRLASGGSSWTAGGDDALPLALAVLDVAAAGRRGNWPAPAGIEFREVCAESGALPGWGCPETVVAPMLAGNHASQFCRVHAAAGRETGSGGVAEAKPAQERKRVKIVSPGSGATYVGDITGMTILPLKAEAAAGRELTWFLDGEVVGTSKSGQPLDWKMRPGSHRLSVSDGDGGTDAVEIRVALNGEQSK